ncbi:MAG: COG1361 S-layer family protein [Candidatus Heimdallarchaeota archaeon]
MNKREGKVKKSIKIHKALHKKLMIQKLVVAGILIIGFMIATSTNTNHSMVLADPRRPWNVVDAFWGTMVMPMEVGPGDENVPLSIIIQYLPYIDILDNKVFPATGISIELDISPPFTVSSGIDPIAIPTLLSVGVGQSQQGPFQPGDVGVVQYELSIHPNALINQTYEMAIHIMYFLDKTTIGKGLKYEADTVPVKVRISGRSRFEVELLPDKITGGRTNLISLRIHNLGTSYSHDTHITIELPPPLILIGMDNELYIDQLLAQSFTEFNLTIYAPEAAIGFTYPIAITVIFKDQTGIDQLELRQLGLMVIGEIDLLVYDLSLFPSEVPANSNVTVSGSLLNRGNIEAMYVNVTLAEDAHFRTTAMSTYYVGQVDPNAPIPFALTAFLQEGVEEGTYPLTLLIEYRDDYGGHYTLTKTTSVVVIPAEQTGPVETPSPDVIQRISDTFFRPIPLLVTAIVIVVLWRILRRKEEA